MFRAWERSHTQRANPTRLQAESLGTLDAARRLEAKADLIAAARPYMQSLSLAVGEAQHAVMLGDEGAVVLEVLGDERSVRGPQRVPGCGAILTEALAGANGIGTPLAEGTYAELVGSEHFIEGFHAFTCQGLPIHGPSGEIAGVLSTSILQTRVSQQVRELFTVTGKGIEAELLLRNLERDIRQMALSHRTDPDLMEKLRQDLIQDHTSGRMSLELAALEFSENQFAAAAQLTSWATEVMERFRAQSAFCLDLVVPGAAPAEVLMIRPLIDQLVQLLATEVNIRRVKVSVVEEAPAASIKAERRELARRLLHLLFRSLELAAGGQLEIIIRSGAEAAALEVQFRPVVEPLTLHLTPALIVKRDGSLLEAVP